MTKTTPEEHPLPLRQPRRRSRAPHHRAKSGTRSYYDPIIDDAVETSSIFPSATSSPSPSPPAATATSPFAGTTASIGKASPSGSARATASRRPATSRTAPTRKDGENKTVRQFVVLSYEPVKLKVREEVA